MQFWGSGTLFECFHYVKLYTFTARYFGRQFSGVFISQQFFIVPKVQNTATFQEEDTCQITKIWDQASVLQATCKSQIPGESQASS